MALYALNYLLTYLFITHPNVDEYPAVPAVLLNSGIVGVAVGILRLPFRDLHCETQGFPASRQPFFKFTVEHVLNF
jgi:hypothetical protein